MLADLTVLDTDIFRIDPHEIRSARAAGTLVGGRFVHRSF
jgi:predicted amidohydrolase YtcJ